MNAERKKREYIQQQMKNTIRFLKKRYLLVCEMKNETKFKAKWFFTCNSGKFDGALLSVIMCFYCVLAIRIHNLSNKP